MTWNEFKTYVDEKLAEQGSDGNLDIWYIDVSHPDNSHERDRPYVTVEKDNELTVWC